MKLKMSSWSRVYVDEPFQSVSTWETLQANQRDELHKGAIVIVEILKGGSKIEYSGMGRVVDSHRVLKLQSPKSRKSVTWVPSVISPFGHTIFTISTDPIRLSKKVDPSTTLSSPATSYRGKTSFDLQVIGQQKISDQIEFLKFAILNSTGEPSEDAQAIVLIRNSDQTGLTKDIENDVRKRFFGVTGGRRRPAAKRKLRK